MSLPCLPPHHLPGPALSIGAELHDLLTTRRVRDDAHVLEVTDLHVHRARVFVKDGFVFQLIRPIVLAAHPFADQPLVATLVDTMSPSFW